MAHIDELTIHRNFRDTLYVLIKVKDTVRSDLENDFKPFG